MNQAGACLTRFGDAQLRRFGPWLLVVLTLLLLLPGNNLLPLIDTDEPRFAQATREMMTGPHANWIVPYFNDNYRFDKPILIYWLMRPCYALFGVNEFAARLPSVICTALLVWLTFHIGARWFNAIAGFTAGFGLLTCVQILMHGRGAVADMPMILAVLAAQYAAFALLHPPLTSILSPATGGEEASGIPSPRLRGEGQGEGPCHWPWFFLFYVALGLGFLAKGPVALIVPLLTLLIHRFVFYRQPLPWRRLQLFHGLPLLLAIIAAWGVPALVQTHGAFFKIGMGEHVIARGHESFQGHGSWAPHYYLLTALFSLFPWIAFTGCTVQAVRRGWNAQNAFLLSWIVATYVLFTLYRTKLPHYVLPAFPALFLLFGQAAQPELTPSRWQKVWFWFINALFVLVGIALLVVAFTFNFPGTLVGLRWMLFGVAGSLFALSSLALHWRSGRLTSMVIPLVALGACTLLLGRGLRLVTPSTQLQPLFQRQPALTAYAWYRFNEQSLVFYAAHPWQSLPDVPALNRFLAQPGPRVAVCLQRAVRIGDYFKMLVRHQSQPTSKPDLTKELAAVAPGECQRFELDGLDIVHGSWVYLQIYFHP